MRGKKRGKDGNWKEQQEKKGGPKGNNDGRETPKERRNEIEKGKIRH